MYVTALIVQSDDNTSIECKHWNHPIDLSKIVDEDVCIRIDPTFKYLTADDVYVDQTLNEIRLAAGWHVKSHKVFFVIQKEHKDISNVSIQVFEHESDADSVIEQAKSYLIDSGLTYTEKYGQIEYISEETKSVWFIDAFVAESDCMVSV